MSDETAQARLGLASGISCVCRRNTWDHLQTKYVLFHLRVLLILYATMKFDTNHANMLSWSLILLHLMRSREAEQNICFMPYAKYRSLQFSMRLCANRLLHNTLVESKFHHSN